MPRYKQLTYDRVLEYAVGQEKIRQYLPDPDKKAKKVVVDRGFLFTIVNTVQPDHFPNEFIRLEREKAEADRKRQRDMVEVSPEILALLEQFGQSNFLRNHG